MGQTLVSGVSVDQLTVAVYGVSLEQESFVLSVSQCPSEIQYHYM